MSAVNLAQDAEQQQEEQEQETYVIDSDGDSQRELDSDEDGDDDTGQSEDDGGDQGFDECLHFALVTALMPFRASVARAVTTSKKDFWEEPNAVLMDAVKKLREEHAVTSRDWRLVEHVVEHLRMAGRALAAEVKSIRRCSRRFPDMLGPNTEAIVAAMGEAVGRGRNPLALASAVKAATGEDFFAYVGELRVRVREGAKLLQRLAELHDTDKLMRSAVAAVAFHGKEGRTVVKRSKA
jgi:hypothetical protein